MAVDKAPVMELLVGEHVEIVWNQHGSKRVLWGTLQQNQAEFSLIEPYDLVHLSLKFSLESITEITITDSEITITITGSR
jgi:hypothetical protein